MNTIELTGSKHTLAHMSYDKLTARTGIGQSLNLCFDTVNVKHQEWFSGKISGKFKNCNFEELHIHEDCKIERLCFCNCTIGKLVYKGKFFHCVDFIDCSIGSLIVFDNNCTTFFLLTDTTCAHLELHNISECVTGLRYSTCNELVFANTFVENVKGAIAGAATSHILSLSIDGELFKDKDGIKKMLGLENSDLND